MTIVKDFHGFLLTEGRVVIKRKYTETHPEQTVSDKAPIRERILSYVSEKREVTHAQLMEFIRGLNEETGGATSRKWVNKNSQYFTVKEKHSTKYYRLSVEGKRVCNAISKKVNESNLPSSDNRVAKQTFDNEDN